MNEGLKKVGQYRLLKLIGKGATSQVYEGRREGDVNKYAIKVIQAKQMTNKQKQMIEKEISIIKSIDHPNIIKLYDNIVTASSYYLIFEFCEKGDLEQYLRDYYGPLIPTKTVRKIIYCIADAIALLHARGIAHRDIKLANILLKKDCTIKLADFGFARQNAEDAMMNSYCGTPITMAPQILSGKPYDKKCDVWSLGVILYRLCFGKLPFAINQGYQAFIEKVINEALKIPREEEQALGLRQLLVGSLQKNPEERITIEQFLHNAWLNEKCPNEQQQHSQIFQSSDSVSEILRNIYKPGATTTMVEESSPDVNSEFEELLAGRVEMVLISETTRIRDRHYVIRSDILKHLPAHRPELLDLLLYYDCAFIDGLRECQVRIRAESAKDSSLPLKRVHGIPEMEYLKAFEPSPSSRPPLQAGTSLLAYLRSISLEQISLELKKQRYQLIMNFLRLIRNFQIVLTITMNCSFVQKVSPTRLVQSMVEGRHQMDSSTNTLLNNVTIIFESRESNAKIREIRDSIHQNCQDRQDAIQKQINGF